MSTIKQKNKKSTVSNKNSDDDSEHELFYYANDRIKLMKEVLKLIKPKKIKAIAPDFMKNLDIDEINSILLEELLGISNKRLKHILNGDNVDTVSTSSDSEQEQKPIDVISLDDISDTDDEFGLGSINMTTKNNSKGGKNKAKHIDRHKLKEIKKEKSLCSKTKESHLAEGDNYKLMNVLEILELQARARAIRSQLALENINKESGITRKDETIIEDDDDDTAVIVTSPRNEEIVITSSDSEGDEHNTNRNKSNKETGSRVGDNCVENNVIASCSIQKDTCDDGEQSSNTKEKTDNNHTDQIQTNELTKEKAVEEIVTAIAETTKTSGQVQKENQTKGEKKCETTYKSDSDNDIINLDSEDIENV